MIQNTHRSLLVALLFLVLPQGILLAHQEELTVQTAFSEGEPDHYDDPEGLGLRIQDVTIREDGIAVLVVRTYAPRPLGSGQLCIRPRRGSNTSAGTTDPGPFTEVLGGMVWNQGGDATCSAELIEGPDGQEMMFTFNSPLGSVNRETDGPLAIIWLRTSVDFQPGDHLDLEFDLVDSGLLSSEGDAVPILPRPGAARFRVNESPIALGVDSEVVLDHGNIEVVAWISTQEELILGSGRLVLTYDVDELTDSPTVVIPWELSGVELHLEESQPGRIVADVSSSEGTWGEVPGPLLTIVFKPQTGVPSLSVALESDSWLVDDLGQPLDLTLSGAVLPALTDLLFKDGFDSGTTLMWSASAP